MSPGKQSIQATYTYNLSHSNNHGSLDYWSTSDVYKKKNTTIFGASLGVGKDCCKSNMNMSTSDDMRRKAVSSFNCW